MAPSGKDNKNIRDNTQNLKEYPLLRNGVELARENFFCLSHSSDIANR